MPCAAFPLCLQLPLQRYELQLLLESGEYAAVAAMMESTLRLALAGQGS